ncbi:hypothetical protein SAMN02982927_03356 [Sporolactobacillus nakayamae]|uniref:Uncharacterized protein n=1 Tax=Sporolactobacillus nakayamae TaxID=269670 RepID=A0A1I2W208_9BACL|nr:hypothetical protein SAMN02982927_03356 [Sporolactobacillus nakayamae]
MIIIKFLDRRRSTWYKIDDLIINCKKSHYHKGEVVHANGKDYCVIDDHNYLRVQPMCREINLYRPIPLDTSELNVEQLAETISMDT